VRPRLGVAIALVGAACAGGKPDFNDAQQVVAALHFPESGGLTVTGAPAPGGLAVTVNRAAAVAVLRVRHSGQTTILFPSRAQPDPHVAAHAVLHIPLTGEERGSVLYEFIAAENGNAWLFTKTPEPGADYVELGTTTREIVRNIRQSVKGNAAAASYPTGTKS
jgi:hypothetical protein